MITMFYTSFEESNAGKKDLIRRWILSKIDYSGVERGQPVCFRDNTSFYHTELPDFRNLSPVFQDRVWAALVDDDVKDDLVRGGLINWCPNARSMVPLSVPRDGNCLLHSVGTAVWGIHDSDLMLRRVLGLVLGIDSGQLFHSRWRHYQQMQLSVVGRPVGLDPEQANREWAEITQCLDPDQSRSRAAPHRFLETIHVYALANVLRRPIIIVTDPTMRTFSGLSLQDNDMGGIYLPLEWHWKETWRTPVILAYTHCHFSPLLITPSPSQDKKVESLVPLVNRHLQQLPVRFLTDQEGPKVGDLLKKYLKIKETVMQVDGRLQNILCTELERFTLPDELCLVKDYLQLCQQQFDQETRGALNQPPVYHRGMSSQAGGRHDIRFQPVYQSSTATPGSQWVGREQLQRMQSNEYSLADPTLCGVWGEGQVHIPPPSFTPRLSFLEQNASLRPPQEKKCVVPGCKYCGDPDLGRMCSQCFKNYSMKESQQMFANRAVRAAPSAPLASMQEEDQQLQMSMMTERCQTAGCGFRCSRQTHPYCHECTEKIQKKRMEAINAQAGTATGGIHPTAVAPSGLPQGGSRVQTVSPLNDLSQPKTSSTVIPQSDAQKTEETSRNIVSPTAGENSSHTMSPTQVLAASSLLAPLTPVDDPCDKLLFGNGQPSPPTEHQPGNVSHQCQTHISPSQLTWEDEARTGQPVQKMKPSDLQSQISSGHSSRPQPPPALDHTQGQELMVSFPSLKENQDPGTCGECYKEGCHEKAVFKSLCVKCYISKGMRPAGPHNPVLDKLKSLSICSKQSSAPASIGRSDVEPTAIAPQTKEMEPVSPARGRNRSSSLEMPTVGSAKQTSNNLQYIQTWVYESSGHVEERQNSGMLSASRNQPLGLPENQETEPLGNDVIASGLECCSPPRCRGDCGNTVQEEGELCGQCRDILRQFRQGQTPHRSLQEGQPGQHPCRTEGCTYFGTEDNLYYCTLCYTRLFTRELEEHSRHAQPPAAHHTYPLSSRPGSVSGQPSFRPSVPGGGQQGVLCCTPGCSMYGDPKQASMCSKHYHQHLARFVAPPHSKLSEHQGRDHLSMQTASLGNQHESHQRHPLQVVDPAMHSTSTVSQHGRTGAQSGVHHYSSAPYSTLGEGRPQAGFLPGVRPPPVTSSLPASPAPFPGQQVWGVPSTREDLSLGATYNRLVAQGMVKCLNPSCSNYGNPKKGGVCNSCARDEALVHRLIYGEEENG